MNDQAIAGSTRWGTAGGVFTVLALDISRADILKTVALAGLGAVVSFTVSLLLKYAFKKWRKS